MAVRDAGTRQDTFVVRLTVDGVDYGIWDKKTGGDVDSETSLYYPGAMKDQQDLGGRATASNITLSRLYDRFDDHDRINTLLSRAGKGKATVSQRPMDEDENEYGKTVIWNGRLKRCSGPPDVDSEGTGPALYEVEISIKGKPVAI